MTFDLALFSSKLKKYRAQFENSLDEISGSTGITVQSLNDLENGNRKPTGDEVLILADYYKCDYQFFISNEKLAPFEQTDTLFRRHGDQFSKKDRWSVQEFLFLCECEEFLLSLIPRKDYKPFSFIKEGNYFKGHGEQAAKKLREHLGYSVNQINSNIYDDFRRLGFHIFRRELGNSNISGLYIRHPVAGKCVLVNYSEDVYRQRFTAAHESAHAILDEEKDFVLSLESDKKERVEVRANTFASRYLMPPEFLSNIPDCRNWNPNKAIEWANKLKVSTQALAYALKNSIVFAKKTNQAFLTDDRCARNLASEVMNPRLVQTTPHLLGWLFFENFLGDSDLQPIINEHEKKYNRKLGKYFKEMYHRALEYRSKKFIIINDNEANL
ncbi:XRE family transcriptional regulator [Sphaerospermopsis sp. LEGE 08334]|uniref:XRE family transcriptional regulator n=1 Tax=Sphaerospermopsis sp. LEGE 08334 TaxID=1828651 RepID=UPI00187F5ABC|nr:XRE family transcriptional regulator [Sphaerospermopsis sp. LEGE 08334]MBE9057574.1 ImmA/IrrE family metallo-endopeptidase [Sphaerospermopsis sp. LEGE 08334]